MRILVADDNGLVRKSAVQFLEHEGHQVFEARDGHEAIDQVERHQPLLVLMDVQMPNMDGVQPRECSGLVALLCPSLRGRPHLKLSLSRVTCSPLSS